MSQVVSESGGVRVRWCQCQSQVVSESGGVRVRWCQCQSQVVSESGGVRVSGDLVGGRQLLQERVHCSII